MANAPIRRLPPGLADVRVEPERHRLPAFDPVPFTCSVDDAVAAVKDVVASYPRNEVVTDDGTYLDTTFTTLVFRFTDTVQFEVDPEAQMIHFRSDSVPYAGSDLGKNRKR